MNGNGHGLSRIWNDRLGGHWVDFNDPATEYRALKDGAALLDWSDHMHFLVTAKTPQKAADFVNGQVSNDVNSLQAGTGGHGAILNRFGKILADCDVLRLERGFVIVVENATSQRIDDHLGRSAVLSRCALTDFGRDYAHMRLLGPAAARLAQAVFPPAERVSGGPVVVSWSLHTTLGLAPCVDLFVGPDAADAAVDALVRAGARLAGTQAYEWWRVDAGIPEYGQDFDDTYILPEVHDEWASPTKGCYVGQEIVAKVRSRGGPIRQVMPLALEGAVGAPVQILSDGAPVGTITSIAALPDGRLVGLGTLRREALSAKKLSAAGRTVTIR